MNDLQHLQGEVVKHLKEAGYSAEFWHSGGGIHGVRVDFGNSEVFSTLDSEGGAWTEWDWTDGSGNYLALLTIQVRPWNNRFGAPGEPEEQLAGCTPVFDKIGGYR